VHMILMTQKKSVTSGTLLSIFRKFIAAQGDGSGLTTT
jgi:hypothetical protein